MIKATTIGSNTVQHDNISWSKRILGNEARTQMKMKIIQDFSPKDTLSFKGSHLSSFAGEPVVRRVILNISAEYI